MEICYRDIFYDYIFDLADAVENTIMSKKHCGVSVIGKYKEIGELLFNLIYNNNNDCCVETDIELYNNCNDGDIEFVISIYRQENKISITCEPLKRDGKYLYHSDEIIYVLDNCNSRIIPYLDADIVYFVGIDSIYR